MPSWQRSTMSTESRSDPPELRPGSESPRNRSSNKRDARESVLNDPDQDAATRVAVDQCRNVTGALADAESGNTQSKTC